MEDHLNGSVHACDKCGQAFECTDHYLNVDDSGKPLNDGYEAVASEQKCTSGGFCYQEVQA